MSPKCQKLNKATRLTVIFSISIVSERAWDAVFV